MSLPFPISYCTPADAPSLTAITLAAYAPSPRFRASFSKVPLETLAHETEESYRSGILHQRDANAAHQKHYLKVTDPESGEMMALAIWAWLPHGYLPEEDSQIQIPEEGMTAGTNEALVRELYRLSGELRSEHPGRGEEHWLLSLLATHPKYERKGAAGLLVRWPFEQADREGKRCYVDSSATGYKLYHRCGFEDVGEIVLDLDKYDASGYGVQRWVAMVREPRKSL